MLRLGLGWVPRLFIRFPPVRRSVFVVSRSPSRIATVRLASPVFGEFLLIYDHYARPHTNQVRRTGARPYLRRVISQPSVYSCEQRCYYLTPVKMRRHIRVRSSRPRPGFPHVKSPNGSTSIPPFSPSSMLRHGIVFAYRGRYIALIFSGRLTPRLVSKDRWALVLLLFLLP